jgi:hypothetical protein
MKKHQNLGLIITLILSGSTLAQANDLYNNLPADVSQVDGGLGLAGAGFAADEFFTGNSCPKGCTLGNITLNLSSETGSSSGAVLQVFSNAAGAPGTSLFTLQDPTSFTTTFGNNIFTVPTGKSFTLNANTDYWVELTNSNTSSILYWDYSQSAVQAALNQPNLLSYQDSNGNAFSGAYGLLMQVQDPQTVGNLGAVPLPGAAWLMGSALIGLATARHKKSRT